MSLRPTTRGMLMLAALLVGVPTVSVGSWASPAEPVAIYGLQTLTSPLGTSIRLGVREKWGEPGHENVVVLRVIGPDRIQRKHAVVMKADNFAFATFPKQFTGPRHLQPGRYVWMYRVGAKWERGDTFIFKKGRFSARGR